MHFTVSRTSFLDALKQCASVAGGLYPRTLVSISDGGTIILRATDSTQSIRVSCDGKSKDEASFAVDASDLSDRIALMPETEPTKIDFTAGKLTITAKGCTRRYTLMTVDADGFPTMPTRPVANDGITISGLGDLLSSVAYAMYANKKDPRVEFGGVELVVGDGAARAYAFNGYGFARSSVASGGAIKTFIPHRVVDVLTGVDEDVEIVASESLLYVTHNRSEIAASLPASAGIAQVFEELALSTRGVVVDIGTLRSAVKAVSVEGREVTIRITSAANKLTLATVGTVDECTESIVTDSTIRFDVHVLGRFLLDALTNLDGDLVTLCPPEQPRIPMALRSGDAVAAIGLIEAPKAAAMAEAA